MPSTGSATVSAAPSPDPARRILLAAGEASGDRYAAELVRALRGRHPDWEYGGMGGAALRAEGVEPAVDSAALGVVGLVEVLRHAGQIRRALAALKAELRARPPDLLVLIDYPEFNLRLARHARRRGVPVLFYVSPQLWAWRAWRARAMRRRVDRMAVIFPFEERFYRERGIPVAYVGHPLVGRTRPSRPAAELRAAFGLDAERPAVGLFPGSRRSELERLLPVCLDAVRELREHPARPQFALAMAPGLDAADYAPVRASGLPVALLDADIHDAIAACDLGLAASGTVTLQLALMGVPFCMMYRLAPLTYAAARLLVRIDRYCLPNIVAGEALVPELIQNDATGERAAAELRPWLDEPERRAAAGRRLGAVAERLGPPVGMTRLADCVEEMLGVAV